jgi:hypothetical protein
MNEGWREGQGIKDMGKWRRKRRGEFATAQDE